MIRIRVSGGSASSDDDDGERQIGRLPARSLFVQPVASEGAVRLPLPATPLRRTTCQHENKHFGICALCVVLLRSILVAARLLTCAPARKGGYCAPEVCSANVANKWNGIPEPDSNGLTFVAEQLWCIAGRRSAWLQRQLT